MLGALLGSARGSPRLDHLGREHRPVVLIEEALRFRERRIPIRIDIDVVIFDVAETRGIASFGPQRIGEHLGIAAVILGAGRRETITEAIELLRIDGVDVEATLKQRFDDGAMRNLDGDVNRTWLSTSYTREPRGHLGQALASMSKIPLTEPLSATISDADTVVLGRPVNADEPAFQLVHSLLPLSISNRRDLSLSLYWRSRRGIPTGPQLAAARVPF